MKLFSHPLSGHSHRVRLAASLLGLTPEIIDVNLLAGAHKQAEFLALNPFGQVPVLEDGDVTLYDSNAILVYLAARYDDSRRWYPQDGETQAHVQIWLSRAANELANGAAAARLVTVFKAGLDHAAAISKAEALLGVLNTTLANSDWLVGENPTIADVALYSYIAHAPEGGVDLRPYTAVTVWLSRIEALPGFVPMQITETDALAALAA
ncbi:MAG: glutathione S-transferase [Glaciecola sp.]|jgi:glutathione S-transferase|uniref:glutathione S-transferase family protein n=1 Tax=Congregibacter sp. TaxID=2744308 RepID=UPI0039E5D4A2